MPAVSSRGRGRRTINEINMVPFIDVMLVLLIIFMVTAPLITPGVINVPSAGQSTKAPEKPINVQIKSDGELSLTGELNITKISEDEAIAAVKEARKNAPEAPVVIYADNELRYQQVISMMVRLQKEAGVQRVSLAVK